MDELGVSDIELMSSSHPTDIETTTGKFETAAAIEVMRLYCLDVGGIADVALLAGVSKSWAYEVVQYWTDNYGDTVQRLRGLFDTNIPDVPILTLIRH